MWLDDKSDCTLGTGTSWLDCGVITHVFSPLNLLRLARDRLLQERFFLRTNNDDLKPNEQLQQAGCKAIIMCIELMVLYRQKRTHFLFHAIIECPFLAKEDCLPAQVIGCLYWRNFLDMEGEIQNIQIL